MPRVTRADLAGQEAGESVPVIEALAPMATGINDDGSFYSMPISQGVAQSTGIGGSATAPGANGPIAIFSVVTGIFDFDVTTLRTGTDDSLPNNMKFQITTPSVIVSSSLLAPMNVPVMRTFHSVAVTAGTVAVYAVGAAGAGCVYMADITATRVG